MLARACVVLLGPMLFCSGCWAPLRYCGIPACQLPDEYRLPRRTAGPPLNLSSLTIPPQGDYILGPDDVLDVTIHSLYPGAEVKPVRVRVMANGEVYLPMVGAVKVGGMNLVEANKVITDGYANGFIRDPRTNVTLAEKSTTSIVVLGEVRNPGVQLLPKYQNDIAHAIAAAGGFAEDAADEIEVHRRVPKLNRVCLVGLTTRPHQPDESVKTADVVTIERPGEKDEVILIDYPLESDGGHASGKVATSTEGQMGVTAQRPADVPNDVLADSQVQPAKNGEESGMRIVRIPLRGRPQQPLGMEDVRVQEGDVIVVPSRKAEVFYVVGKLASTNFVRFNIGARERDLGAGFLLPRDREIDVVTAVAMAGYIDPIDSPTTVTLQRVAPDGEHMLIIVDLIAARHDRTQTILVEAGDIIYLNPDAPWWFRRTFDRLVENFFSFGMGITYQIPNGSTRQRP
jgi:protein involved in polysaccharide export with SLBB domain